MSRTGLGRIFLPTIFDSDSGSSSGSSSENDSGGDSDSQGNGNEMAATVAAVAAAVAATAAGKMAVAAAEQQEGISNQVRNCVINAHHKITTPVDEKLGRCGYWCPPRKTCKIFLDDRTNSTSLDHRQIELL